MTGAEILKAFIEVGMLGTCAVMMLIIFYENHKRSHQTDDEKNKLIVDNYNKIESMISSLTTNIQEQNNKLLEQQEKHYEKESERANKLITTIITGVTQHVPTAEEDKRLDEINIELKSTLNMLKEDTNANRACIVQYHNGGRGINNQSFQKMSMTLEEVKINTKPIIGEFKDQYRMSLSYFVNTLRDEGRCYINNINTVKDKDTSTYEYMNFNGINSLFGLAITGPENNVVAFVALTFKDKNLPNLELINEAFDKYHTTFQKALNKKG